MRGGQVSLYDYRASLAVTMTDPPFYALVMAAMRGADTTNAARLRMAFPDTSGGYFYGPLDGPKETGAGLGRTAAAMGLTPVRLRAGLEHWALRRRHLGLIDEQRYAEVLRIAADGGGVV